MLNFEKQEWRFETPGPIPRGVIHAFRDFIEVIAKQGDTKSIVENCKCQFGNANVSSSLSWAWSDLHNVMESAADNAPTFIEAFYKFCETMRQSGLAVPSLDRINRVLATEKVGFEVRPPNLVATRHFTSIAVPEKTPSLEEQAKPIIEGSLARSSRLLQEGEGRQAVTEVLWLLETITTAFRNADANENTIEGKYFNQIVRDLANGNRGSAQEQILKWIMPFYGFLSSPTGGAVRHGQDLRTGSAMGIHEARLYCNLIKSYITYFIETHERLNS